MAREEDISFERITRVYRDESQRKTLAPLEPDFYEKVNRYLTRLEADLAAERGKDPNAKGAMLLQDELRKALQKREQVLHYRERKIALLAIQQAGGGEADVRGLARPEQELLRRLVDVLRAHRAEATGLAPAPTQAAAPATSAAEPPAAAAPKGVLLHILEDVPPFAGPDGTYRLRKEDLVTLPPPLAKVLVERGKARVVNAAP